MINLKGFSDFLIKNKQTEIDSRLDKFIELFLASDENELYFNLLKNNSSYIKIFDSSNEETIENKEYDINFRHPLFLQRSPKAIMTNGVERLLKINKNCPKR